MRYRKWLRARDPRFPPQGVRHLGSLSHTVSHGLGALCRGLVLWALATPWGPGPVWCPASKLVPLLATSPGAVPGTCEEAGGATKSVTSGSVRSKENHQNWMLPGGHCAGQDGWVPGCRAATPWPVPLHVPLQLLSSFCSASPRALVPSVD